MHLSLPTIALAALLLKNVYAHPAHGFFHRKHRRDGYAGVNWNDPSLYKNVDWSAVNYGGGSTPAPPTTSIPAPAPTPVPAPPNAQNSPSPPPTVHQDSTATNTNANTNSAPGPATSTSGKRGLAYNPSSGDLNVWSSYSALSWGYNWADTPQGLPSRLQYVPTLWGTASVHSGNWASAVKAATAGPGPHYLMSFNEPDNPGQANMDVGTAVAAFRQYMTPYASDGADVLLGSPSVTNAAGTNAAGIPQGLDWLSAFLKQCTGCPVSFVPIHWYGCRDGCAVEADVADFESHVRAAVAAAVDPATGAKVPVWVTEFESFTDPGGFLGQVLPWLDAEAGVQRYAYFMAAEGILMDGGAVSKVGVQYAS